MPESTPTPIAAPAATPTATSAPERLVWDLPTRLFHWTLAVLFGGAFTVALSSSEHSRAFMIHMLLGLVLAFAVLLRLLWGLVGSRPSRFASFLYSPAALGCYLREVFRGTDRPVAGHNPGSSYAALAMLLLPLGLVATGLLKVSGQEWAEEVHAALAYGMVATVAIHVLGVLWHARRHRDGLPLAMVHGRRSVPEAESLASPRPWAALAFVLLLGGWGMSLVRGYDPVARQVQLPLVGTVLPLGEAKEGREAKVEDERGERHRDDD